MYVNLCSSGSMCHITLTGVASHHRPKNVQPHPLVSLVTDHSTHETGFTTVHGCLVAGTLPDLTYHGNNDNIFFVIYFIKGCIYLVYIHLISINLQKYLRTYKKQLSANFSVKKLQLCAADILYKCLCVTKTPSHLFSL